MGPCSADFRSRQCCDGNPFERYSPEAPASPRVVSLDYPLDLERPFSSASHHTYSYNLQGLNSSILVSLLILNITSRICPICVAFLEELPNTPTARTPLARTPPASQLLANKDGLHFAQQKRHQRP